MSALQELLVEKKEAVKTQMSADTKQVQEFHEK